MRRVAEINALEPAMQHLTPEELRCKTEEFRMRLAAGRDSLDALLPEAFAAVREASRRALNLRHFDVQLIGGMALHSGEVAQMATGEGKTLVATLPAYLNALPGRGVHIVTVNPYLATRDATWMGRVFALLGLSTGVVTSHRHGASARAAFQADVTYVTANHLGWIYLIDNTSVENPAELCLARPFHYAIVDEADSVLIDDVVNPLIISSNPGQPGAERERWRLADQVVRAADWEGQQAADELPPGEQPEGYEGVRVWGTGQPWPRDAAGRRRPQLLINRQHHSAIVTEAGYDAILACLARLGHPFPEARAEGRPPTAGDLWFGAAPLGPYVEQRLRAQLFESGTHYLVREGKVVLLSQTTGRPMEDSQWQDGLHQAVEVKEGLAPSPMNHSSASVTYQKLFSLYPRMAGMTGTAKDSESELFETYGLTVQVIPLHRPSRRVDHPMEVYTDYRASRALPSRAKTRRLRGLVADAVQRGQPVLLGTHSVEESELWASVLRAAGVQCQVLNARPAAVAREAAIVAQAGLPMTAADGQPAVTIATSMAGRGTDIRLGGDPAGLTRLALAALLLPLRIDREADPEGWADAAAERCPLMHWPRDARGLRELGDFLPPPLVAALKSAAAAAGRPEAAAPSSDARAALDAALEAAEPLVREFLDGGGREGHRQGGPQAQEALLRSAAAFVEERAPLAPLARDWAAGVASWTLRAAALLWVWLEACHCPQMAEEARRAGGLRVVCASLGPSWRVVNQLRGRCGRQGDPGETFLVLNVFEDVLADVDVRDPAFAMLARWMEGDAGEVLPEGLALRLAVAPAMRAREHGAAQARHSLKETDEVLHVIRRQAFAERRWLIGAQPRQLHRLLRAHCYDAAADLVLQHVDPAASPRAAERWRLEELLRDVWLLVNGELSAAPAGTPIVVACPVDELFGVAAPGDGSVPPLSQLQAAAGQLRAWLLDPQQPQLPLPLTPELDAAALQADMLEARAAFLQGAEDRHPDLRGRHKRQALQLLTFLACVLYTAWVGPKRTGLKRLLRLAAPPELLVFDAAEQPPPTAAEAGGRGVVDAEELLQAWERRALADTLSEMLSGLVQEGDLALQAARAASLSFLTPVTEYTSDMSRRFVRLLDDHRVCCVHRLFEGPELLQPWARQVAAGPPALPPRKPVEERAAGGSTSAERLPAGAQGDG